MTLPKHELEEENRKLRERLKQLEREREHTRAPTEVGGGALIEYVKRAACSHFGISKAQLDGITKTKTLARARRITILVIKKMYPWISSNEIGAAMHRDHSTILVSLRHGKDKDLQEYIALVEDTARHMQKEETGGT